MFLSRKLNLSSDKPSLQALNSRLGSQGGRILIIQTAFLGDAILATSLVKAVKMTYPECVVSVLAIPQCKVVFQGLADEIIEFDKRKLKGVKTATKKIIELIKGKAFDLAFIPHRSARSGFIARSAGIPIRIGFKRGAGRAFHTHTAPYDYNAYECQRNLDLLRCLTPFDSEMPPELCPQDSDQQTITNILSELSLLQDSYAVIAPGSVWRTKRWRPERFHAVIKELEEQFRIPSFIIGGAEDFELGASVAYDPKFNLVGRLSLLESASLVNSAKFLISCDSAPAHIATAVSARQLIIFGSTAPRFGFAPPYDAVRLAGVDLWCRPCTNHGRQTCPIFGSTCCLNDQTPEMIMDLLKDWL